MGTIINVRDKWKIQLYDVPNECPFCHKIITPKIFEAYANPKHDDSAYNVEVVFACPNNNCQQLFIGYYRHESGYQNHCLKGITKGNIKNIGFSDTINNISNSFSNIYNESNTAEQEGLKEICGVGYRKALEFLIKDYCTLKHPNEKEKIEKMFLGNCIEKYILDSRVKSMAKRATWLGNDETHHIRKWEGKNLADLKKLIELTIHWIEMETLSEGFENEMRE